MGIEYNKANALMCLFVGILSFAERKWIYGSLLIVFGATILMQYAIIISSDSGIIQYKYITKIPSLLTLFVVIIASIVIINKTRSDISRKVLPLLYLGLSLSFAIFSSILKGKALFSYSISKYIPGLLFMLMAVSVSYLPDNQLILLREYRELERKLDKL
jgi:peptidoglycan/LPS O-acetylase OafA/YrhL